MGYKNRILNNWFSRIQNAAYYIQTIEYEMCCIVYCRSRAQGLCAIVLGLLHPQVLLSFEDLKILQNAADWFGRVTVYSCGTTLYVDSYSFMIDLITSFLHCSASIGTTVQVPSWCLVLNPGKERTREINFLSLQAQNSAKVLAEGSTSN